MFNFCTDTRGLRWSLVSVRLFSRDVGRERHCRQISLACAGSVSSVLATLCLPPLVACVPFPSTLFRLQAALQGAGLELHAVPVFGSSTKVQTQLGLLFVTFLVRAAQAARGLRSTLSLGAVHLIPSVVPASVCRHASRVCLVSLLGG